MFISLFFDNSVRVVVEIKKGNKRKKENKGEKVEWEEKESEIGKRKENGELIKLK